MEEFRMTMRGALEGIVAHFGGLQWLELSEPVRLSYRKSLYRDWQRIKEMELHPAGMASLEFFVHSRRSRHQTRRGPRAVGPARDDRLESEPGACLAARG